MKKLKMHSPDLTQENIAKLAELFPNCVTETQAEDGKLTRAIDFDQLRQELSTAIVEGPQESYQLNWPGKREALLTANAPIAKTLRPCRDESVDFDTTQNLFIEGDNLDALKLLQETYLNKVKLIYIDPPYNTGSDLVYNDEFKTDTTDYFARSNQQDAAGNRLVANLESNGRFHSDWLTMMYPRLKLARNLLKDEGVIFISIDDNEIENLKKLCDEIFGAANFIACMVWEKGRKNDAKLISVGHEYILIFAKSLDVLRTQKTIWREEKPGAREIWDKYLELRSLHGSNEQLIESDLQGWYSSLPKTHPSKKWARYKRVDTNGPWRDRDISWPGGGGPRYDVLHPETGKPCKVPESGWRFEESAMKLQIKLGLVEFRADESQPPFRKAHIRPIPAEIEAEVDVEESEDDDGEEQFATQVRGSYFYKQSQVAVKFLRGLMGAKAFNNPKDHFELARLIAYVTANEPEAIVLDFFAGSASTGHAVFQVNQTDGGRRRFVLVQLPEELDADKKEQKVAANYCDELGKPRNISEISKERMRRAGKKIQEELAEKAILIPALSQREMELDVGFRVLKVDSSNMKDVYYAPDAVQQADLLDQVDNIREDRTPEDLLFQVLLDWGVDLALPITQETFKIKDEGGRMKDEKSGGDSSFSLPSSSFKEYKVFFVDGNALAACFETGINEEFVKALAARHPLRAVFRDSGFGSDSVKINIEQIFKLISPTTEVKTI
ncbi:MAG: site-specific DNA-methyltransferase [Sideroxyarcus sp.]|nr:site-specific DNA-methyltransferase [Sideroxyarcus sp.]